MKNKKGFTLIELIAVLVIMAILALIVTPIVMSIIKKTKTSADKRSIDGYGRSIELAVTGYLMDNGAFPTSIEDLTIEYSGPEVVCSTTQLNQDSSVYLTGCTVNGRSVDYEYGTYKPPTYQAYEIGDEVTYNNVAYRVIKDSGTSESTVTLLKVEPLTLSEVNQYGAGHINRYTSSSQGTAYDLNGYGGMAYYTSETCGFVNNTWISDGCTTDYAQSDIKYAVDAWTAAKAPQATEARLITLEDLLTNLGYDESSKRCTGSCWYNKAADTPSWLYNSNYIYWTGSQYEDSDDSVWYVNIDGNLNNYGVNDYDYTVRPVIVLSKTLL